MISAFAPSSQRSQSVYRIVATSKASVSVKKPSDLRCWLIFGHAASVQQRNRIIKGGAEP